VCIVLKELRIPNIVVEGTAPWTGVSESHCCIGCHACSYPAPERIAPHSNFAKPTRHYNPEHANGRGQHSRFIWSRRTVMPGLLRPQLRHSIQKRPAPARRISSWWQQC
jgi:hypothetical protein